MHCWLSWTWWRRANSTAKDLCGEVKLPRVTGQRCQRSEDGSEMVKNPRPMTIQWWMEGARKGAFGVSIFPIFFTIRWGAVWRYLEFPNHPIDDHSICCRVGYVEGTPQTSRLPDLMIVLQRKGSKGTDGPIDGWSLTLPIQYASPLWRFPMILISMVSSVETHIKAGEKVDFDQKKIRQYLCPEGKHPCSYGFPKVLPWFSYDFPIKTYAFPMFMSSTCQNIWLVLKGTGARCVLAVWPVSVVHAVPRRSA